MFPEEFISLLDYVSGSKSMQYGALLLGAILTLIGRIYSAQYSTFISFSLKTTAMAVWVLCWIIFPNTLVKVLYHQGPYIIKKTFFLPPPLTSLFSGYLSTAKKGFEIEWDCFSILLLMFTLIQLLSGIASALTTTPCSPQEPLPIVAPPLKTPNSFAVSHPFTPTLPPSDVALLKATMRRVRIKVKLALTADPCPPNSVLVEDLISLCPAHLKNWLVKVFNSCHILPSTYLALTAILEDALAKALTPKME